MGDADARARGIAEFERVMASSPPEVTDPFLEATVDHLFADVWSRPGLSPRDRRLVTIGMLAPQDPDAALHHLRAALGNGEITPDEVDEIVVQAAHYAGWPWASKLYVLSRPVLAEHRRGQGPAAGA